MFYYYIQVSQTTIYNPYMKNMDINTARRQFGPRLQLLREQHHMTQEELAEKLGVNPDYLSRVETGKRLLGLKKIFLVRTLFQVDMEFLLCGVNLSDVSGIPAEIVEIFHNEDTDRQNFLCDSAASIERYADAVNSRRNSNAN